MVSEHGVTDFADDAPEKLSISRAFYIALKYLLIDIIVYGSILPLVGIYFANGCANLVNLGSVLELLLAVIFAFIMPYMSMLVISFEGPFWKHYLALEPFYAKLLKVRDLVNFLTLVVCFMSLDQTIQTMMTSSTRLKSRNIGDGVGYFFLKTLFRWMNIDEGHLDKLGLNPPHQKEATELSVMSNSIEEYELNGEYVYYWAMLSACIARFAYFNAMSTTKRALEIFVSLRPSFYEDDDYDESFEEDFRSVNFTNFEKAINRPIHYNREHEREDSEVDKEAAALQYSYIS